MVFTVARHKVVADKVVLTLKGLDEAWRRGLALGGWEQVVEDASTMRGAGSPFSGCSHVTSTRPPSPSLAPRSVYGSSVSQGAFCPVEITRMTRATIWTDR